jgi:motility quorum-sensing regulator/GCU-specific mRNA interferase toxin
LPAGALPAAICFHLVLSPRVSQDVYHVPSPAGVLYVKFTADVVTEFPLLSFKEKGDA